MRHVSRVWIIAIVSFGLSLLAKFAADHWLAERIPIVGDLVGLHYSQNPGVAFGILLPSFLQLPLILCAFVFVWYLSRKHVVGAMSTWGYGFILGGAMGNIVDRLFDGLVTDFVQVGRFPIFNIADSFITVGVVLLLVESLAVSLQLGRTQE